MHLRFATLSVCAMGTTPLVALLALTAGVEGLAWLLGGIVTSIILSRTVCTVRTVRTTCSDGTSTALGGSAKCTSAIFAKCGAFQGKNDTKACEVCVEVASQALMRDHTCTQQGLGIALFELCSPPVPGGGGGGSGASGSQALMLDKVIPLAQRLNGSWYSTEAEGECVGDARPGDGSGCYWRLLENTRIVNASCVNGRC
jgi:hypothetical protein